MRVTPKKLHHSKKKGRLLINTCCVSNPEKTQQFINKLEENFHRGTPADDTIDTKWPHFRDAVYTSAIDSYGKKKQNSSDWYEAHWEEIEPVTEAKRKAYLAYKANDM